MVMTDGFDSSGKLPWRTMARPFHGGAVKFLPIMPAK